MENKSSGAGISATSVLGIVFVVLKLCNVIDWSWWWVLSPFWLPITIALAIILVAVIIKAFMQ